MSSIAVRMEIDVTSHGWWAGAEDTVEKCVNAGKGTELADLIDGHFSGSVPDEQDVNDFLRFEDDYIFSALGISGEDEDGDDTDDEGD